MGIIPSRYPFTWIQSGVDVVVCCKFVLRVSLLVQRLNYSLDYISSSS